MLLSAAESVHPTRYPKGTTNVTLTPTPSRSPS
ncbi:unnamed protein product, partial [Adineta ricciae]